MIQLFKMELLCTGDLKRFKDYVKEVKNNYEWPNIDKGYYTRLAIR